MLLYQIEMMVKLIRSKGVGIFFITQNPTDIPDPVLAQLGNRIKHALRAYTPKEQKAVRTAAETFRQKDGQDVEKMISELQIGEALVSTLDEKGIPSYVDRVTILPPRSKFGTADPAVMQRIMNSSVLYTSYVKTLDRESASEMLQSVSNKKSQKEAEAKVKDKEYQKALAELKQQTADEPRKAAGRPTLSPMEKVAKSVMTDLGRQVSRELTRGLFGILKKL